jgi:hypothetical protein
MKEKENVENYFKYINEHIKSIESISLEHYDEIYKKLLYVSVIDLLSQTVFPNKSPRSRVVSLLKRFSNWKYGYYVSLPHLFRLLQKNPDPTFEKLRMFTKRNLEKWGNSELITLDRDLLYDDAKNLWPKNSEYKFPIENISLESLTHYELFYTYRNSLVHELHALSWLDRKSDEEPFYMHVTSLGDDLEPIEECWSLNYPITFFRNILSEIIKGVEEYLLHNELDPYAMMNLGHYWLDSLNKK